MSQGYPPLGTPICTVIAEPWQPPIGPTMICGPIVYRSNNLTPSVRVEPAHRQHIRPARTAHASSIATRAAASTSEHGGGLPMLSPVGEHRSIEIVYWNTNNGAPHLRVPVFVVASQGFGNVPDSYGRSSEMTSCPHSQSSQAI